MKKKLLLLTAGILLAGILIFQISKRINLNSSYEIGQPIDSLNGVLVYYNGGISHVSRRNVDSDGYNIGMKYQCVEFVKRYYYEYYHHKMPDSYGNAIDFFDKNIADGQKNLKRNLIQYSNPGSAQPAIGDILIFEGSAFNKYGHVAIVSEVNDNGIEIIQQNPGPFAKSRVKMKLMHLGDKWRIENKSVLGWLRKEVN